MLLDNIVRRLNQLTGLPIGKGIFANFYPDEPDKVISVIDLGGLPPNRYTPIRERKIEIKFRTDRYPEGINLGNQIFNEFHSRENYVLGDFFIYSSYAETEVSYLYSDSKNRKEFSIELIFMHRN